MRRSGMVIFIYFYGRVEHDNKRGACIILNRRQPSFGKKARDIKDMSAFDKQTLASYFVSTMQVSGQQTIYKGQLAVLRAMNMNPKFSI